MQRDATQATRLQNVMSDGGLNVRTALQSAAHRNYRRSTADPDKSVPPRRPLSLHHSFASPHLHRAS